jgi:hypothetical protein
MPANSGRPVGHINVSDRPQLDCAQALFVQRLLRKFARNDICFGHTIQVHTRHEIIHATESNRALEDLWTFFHAFAKPTL